MGQSWVSVDVALQEGISWEKGWRSCFATQGTTHEHEYLCSAPLGITKYPNLAASAQDGVCPFVPRQTRLGWNIVAASAGPGAWSWCCRDGAPALSCLLTSGSLQIPNLVRILAESPGQGGWGEQKRAAFLVPFIMGCNSCLEGVTKSSFGFVLPTWSPSTTKP